MANTIAELLQLVTDKVLTGGRRTLAQGLRDVYNPIINSFLSKKDGGFVVEQEAGYTTEITITDNKSFAHKKYVDDLVGSIGGGLNYLGVWNATTNTPSLSSSIGNSGDYYIVDVAGSTDLDGITDWNVGDWVIFSTVWQKIDNSEELQDLESVLSQGNVSTTIIETTGFVKTGGTSSEFLKADGSVDSNTYLLAIENAVVGENVVVGDLLYIKSDGKYWKADYLDEARVSTELRIANETILANATGKVVVAGLVNGLIGLTTGENYYVGANGSIVKYSDIPDTEGIFVRIVGTAKSTTSLEFSPDESYIETTQTAIGGGGGGATDLSYTASPTNGIVVSSTGTDAIIPLADVTNAGLLTPAEKTKLANTSGTNTGDQTITLTSDVTGSGTGSFATTISANVVSNTKLAQMGANTVKVNNTNATANATDLTLPTNTVLGRESGNIVAIPTYNVIIGTATLITGTVTIFDIRITISSFVSGLSISSTGTSTSEIKWTTSAGQMTFTSVVGTDTATFGYTIII